MEPIRTLERTIAPQPVAVSELKAIAALETLLRYMGEEPLREGLLDTPARVLKSYGELYGGYRLDPAEILSRRFAEVAEYDERVLLKDIAFHSTCEHHMMPFQGVAHVAYLPGEHVVGLSKLARLVDCFARRLQIQERLTRQIAVALMDHLEPRGAAVIIEAHHGCMGCRGVRKPDARMVTSAFEGALREPAARMELLTHLRG